MHSNRLQLNIDKTGLLWCSSSRRQHHFPSAPLLFGGKDVTASSVVRKHDVFVDSDLKLLLTSITMMSSLRDASLLLRLYSDNIDGAVTNLYAARLGYCKFCNSIAPT
jgi:hypothetical protein